jgi:CDP-diacylglycerol--glycerol-3-phosphate 3-phosphatidyltransferase
MALFLSDVRYGNYISALVFALAALTDTFDGYLARLRRETTKIGEIIDPFADKLLISAALISLVQAGRLSAWFAVVIISREFLVSALRAVALSSGVSVPASRLGKTKTVFQIIAILLCVIYDGSRNLLSSYLYLITWSFLLIAMVLTIYSAYDYFVKIIPMINPGRGSDEN